MRLSVEEQEMLDGKLGKAAQKSMQMLVALGTIYGAERMIPVASVQIAGVSYDNLGEAGLEFLTEMAEGGGQTRVLTTLNPAGMDIENWEALGIDPDFAEKQKQVIEAFRRMNIVTTCSCTPYLAGNVPLFGEHLAWSESSAVCYANSVLGARTNREGGPSALAAAITGRTPEYGYHLDETRRPAVTVLVQARLADTTDFGALGKAIGEKLESARVKRVSLIQGVREASQERVSMEKLKTFCASLATFGGAAIFHMPGVTPEASHYQPPEETLIITQADLDEATESLTDAAEDEIDFISLGCPHLTILEVAHIAELLQGKRVTKEFWITTSRPIKHIADRMGYTQIIEACGAKIAADTCCVVAPIRGRFHALATDSAKACYYAYAKNQFKTRFMPFDQVVELSLR